MKNKLTAIQIYIVYMFTAFVLGAILGIVLVHYDNKSLQEKKIYIGAPK